MTTRPRVLVVDADSDRAGATVDALATTGRDSTAVDDADAALVELGDHAVDCVICERDLGDRSAIDLLETVRDVHGDVPFVVLTADGDEALAERAVALDVTAYVRRVDDWQRRLDDAVSRAVDDGRDRTGVLTQRALDEAPVGITIADADADDMPLVYTNDAFVDLTGYDRADVVGRNCRFLQGEDSDPDAVAEMRAAIEAETSVTTELANYTADGEKFWNRVDIAPVRDADGDVTHFVGFQTDVSERVNAERVAERRAAELATERESLQHVLERIDGLVQDAGQALVEATTRESVETATCDLIVDNDPYTCAWVGEPDLAEKTIAPTAIAGGTPDGDPLDLRASDGPIQTAIETGETQVVDVADLPDRDWHEARVDDAFATVAVVPLSHRDAKYGVLCAYVDDATAVDDREVAVLNALGRMAGTAISAVETRRTLTADDVVSLAFTVRNRDAFFVRIAEDADVSLSYAGSMHRDDDRLGMFFTVETDDPDRLEAVAADLPDVVDVTVVTATEGACLVEFEVENAGLLSTLADYGADIREITASPTNATVEVELPRDANARSLVDHVESAFADVELTAYRERDRADATKQEFVAALEADLTDRQLTALRRAYFGEFFEWPRPTSGDDLAESMGIARSTYHQHLRAAERKLVGEFFDRP
ncbi:PAS domain-containing protein [Halorubellus sp. JP-L1]|uniref:bacterio-opsin activator domain-containing protein n=1 Tax=Halorubellus sp. JP-L1 TaxID=2715753 RepID=UPI00140A4118|nr:bacterio-opsin activator domain-containing protein [Halorubellus sp. JP-L1]NHN41725.1 PAS domain-containing protein [Halorubellus sp. JP-L1]